MLNFRLIKVKRQFMWIVKIIIRKISINPSKHLPLLFPLLLKCRAELMKITSSHTIWISDLDLNSNLEFRICCLFLLIRSRLIWRPTRVPTHRSVCRTIAKTMQIEPTVCQKQFRNIFFSFAKLYCGNQTLSFDNQVEHSHVPGVKWHPTQEATTRGR